MTVTTHVVEYVRATDWDDLTGEQQQRLADERVRWNQDDPFTPWADGIMESLKAVVGAAGFTLTDWQIGVYNRHNYITIGGGDDYVVGLHGKRALAWLENTVLGPHRIPWTGPGRESVRRFGRSYRPGLVNPCPLTGLYADDALLAALRDALVSGSTVGEAIRSLADVVASMITDEYEQYTSEDYARECEADGGPWEWPASNPLLIERA